MSVLVLALTLSHEQGVHVAHSVKRQPAVVVGAGTGTLGPQPDGLSQGRVSERGSWQRSDGESNLKRAE